MLNVTAVWLSPSFDDDGLDAGHQAEGVALGEVERAHQPGPDPLGALPLDAIAVVAPHGHELLAQEPVDGAPHRLGGRRDDAAHDDLGSRPACG